MPWSLIFLSLTAASWVYWLVAGWCIEQFFAEPQPPADPKLPPVSVLKPIRGLDAEAYKNLSSFMLQDYPEYEVLFGVTDPHDPALELIARLQREFPRRKIRAFVASPRGANDKVSVLCHLAQMAYYDTLVICDSDMRVTPDYLRRICAPLQDPAVGLVTSLYRGTQAETLTAKLEAQYISTTFLPGVLVGRNYLHMGFALGASNALRREQLRQIGGFEALVNYLADDYQLGAKIAATGHRVHLSDYMAQSVLGATTFREQWNRELRWAKCLRVSRPLEYPVLLFTLPTPMSLVTAAAMGFSPAGLGVIGASLALRWLVSWQLARHTRDQVYLRSWYLLPLRDLLTYVIWCGASVGREVTWRGRRFALRKGGFLQQLFPPQEAHEVAR
ncbi:MAG TPA: bacteriohopanetetrol glucosamine biosynthesis glycosyltransferase HpnI [Anaerolineae bacterium]|nr:bacteriohopanetetrol glucosamine biosynthesis glycosyltransferase HpnI [Anaerolineae bacterium]HOQ99400.1 bacteriohopanetetrol glucosamine biosynthesis glycosyltransferase HpnI [Anaerolineae bacterium]HPL27804.1 bacteriohopanetetrol glucosamine biosynthesis glycosyltransferase HpnI [Anaerolineae bacterium]